MKWRKRYLADYFSTFLLIKSLIAISSILLIGIIVF
nr:MAG TPA: hypothetical protein [Caudoviricetes sp.]